MSGRVSIPPQNLDAEKAVLGGVLLDNNAILDLSAALKPDSFYLPSHGRVFSVMLELYERQAPIDVVSVNAAVQDVSISDLVDI